MISFVKATGCPANHGGTKVTGGMRKLEHRTGLCQAQLGCSEGTSLKCRFHFYMELFVLYLCTRHSADAQLK